MNVLMQAAPAATKLTTAYDLAIQGGWLMIPIAICSVVALGYIVERWIALSSHRLIPSRFKGELEQAMAQGPEKALELCEKERAIIGRVFAAGLRRWNGTRADVEHAIEDAGGREVTLLQRKLRPLMIVVALAPLLGLLGTVFGMIEAFQAMAAFKAKGADVLAGGIAKALITTAAGLLVAIPAQVAWYWLRGKVDRFGAAIETLFDQTLARQLDARETAVKREAA